MKQTEYLRLIALGRKLIHYARPSDADDALTGLIGVLFVLSLALVFGIAILATYLGEPMDARQLGWPLIVTAASGVVYFVFGIFIGGAPRMVRCCMLLTGATVIALLAYLALAGAVDGWYLFIPPALFAALVSIAVARQLRLLTSTSVSGTPTE